MEFRCGNSSPELLYFTCLNSGSCEVDSTLGEHCICPHGWAHDVVGYGRFYDCSVPESLLKNFFIAYMCLAVIFVPIAAYQMKTSSVRGKVREIGLGCIGWALSAWLHVIVVFAQNGFYEGGLVTFAILATIGFLLAAHTFPVLLRPVALRISAPNLSNRLSMAAYICASSEILVIYVFTILAYPHVRDPNPATYNLLILCMLLQADVALFLGCSTIFSVGIWLLKLLRRLPGTTGIMKQVRIIILFQALLVSASIVVLCFLILWFMYSSVPLMIVPWILQNVILMLLLPLAIPFFASYVTLNKPSTQEARIPLSGSAEIEPGSSEQRFMEPHITIIQGPVSSQLHSGGGKKSRIRRKVNRYLTRISENGESSIQSSQASRVDEAGS